MAMMSGAQIFVESLLKEKVEVIFGIPGGVVIPVYDALFDSPLRIILTRHEQGASHAADGYARATGRVGVCLVTSGPGACNTVTGMATANMDSIPIVVFTGQVPTPMIGNDAFQEADIVGISRPVTKHNFLVRDVKDLARTVKEAFHIASTGRPGPVLVDLPKDVTTAETEFHYPSTIDIRGYKPVVEGNMKQIKRAAELINASRKAVIYAGGGVILSGASKELIQLAHKTGIPVTTSMLALGAFPANDKLFLGMPGMHGTRTANYALTECDLIVAVGTRFDDRVTGNIKEFAVHAQVIHIDIDPTTISKSVRVHVPIVGDAAKTLTKLIPLVKRTDNKEWLKQVDEWKEKYPLAYKDSDSEIKPQYVVQQIYEVTQGDAIITTEVGQNQMWAAQYYKFNAPRTFLSSGGLGTMGYGLPAAIGAQIGRPDKVVFDIAGDGSIQMNIQELATAVHNKLPVNIAILNNHFLGMVRQWQELFHGKRYSSSCLIDNPDFVKVAEAYGAKGIRVTEKKDVRPAIEEAAKSPHTWVLDFEVTREENVYPMVPSGKAIREMIGGLA
ncbi:MAG: biosynthetic-type acetolactate synthase large subunit [Candidatus Abyssobacteria bacterium SURF_17]|uniref:Acetolactate synthase n=1 Tax=Candidatus Abyssobacteria bacterium SURF_17 TaxID=2093361 RepID=A0A419EZD1_9BACT|nr:MAG: biosynthetic-type acetolactate synthase large subunit [Candidatus Abyssubacteria bacterium SURF_17]